MVHNFSGDTSNVHVFDARGVAKRFRHAAIFGALNALESGETMRFYNDHNPQPLLAQIEQHFGPHIKVNYIAREAGEVVIDFLVST
jgi:uncharacterized protein (DUF2249 family)